MDRIEPIRPSPPAIAPIDTTRVRRVSRDADRPLFDERAARREQARHEGDRDERKARSRHEWTADEEHDGDEEADDEGRPSIDVRA